MAGDLRAGRESLEQLWRQGVSGRTLLAKYTVMVDDFLRRCFKEAAVPAGAALVALGGYGRRELFPFSDIDLMILHDHLAEKELSRLAEAVFYPVWDAGLELGHAVRTVEACLEDAGEDFFFQVAFLDHRLIAGDSRLVQRLAEAFRRRYIDGARREFFVRMEEHRAKRHQRFGMHTYLLEPQVKESRGGLRDVQAMLWTSRVVFGLDSLGKMVDAGLLEAQEGQQFQEAWDRLVRIRNRLHYVAGRKNDQLYFAYQEEMARAFGYRDRPGTLAVETFMHDVHDAMQTVAVTCELFFEHTAEVLGIGASGPDLGERRLEEGVVLRRGRVCLLDSGRLAAKPPLLMRLFWYAAHHDAPIHYRTRKQIQGALAAIDDRFRRSRRVARTFLELLQEPGAAGALAVMLETGVLAAYLPEFAPLESLAQHDVYHVNTVDRHLIQTVAELAALRGREEHVFELVRDPAVLFLAGLCHDIGKGHGQGHAGRGAQLVRTLGGRLGLPQEAVADLAFLVEHHLFLINIALRRDLDDEVLILRCAEQVGRPDRLAMLYLLTVADARATGPSVWTDWKAALVLELYLKIAHLLERSDLEGVTMDQDQAVGWMVQQVGRLVSAGGAVDPAALPPDYLLGFSPPEIARHIELHGQLPPGGLILEPSEGEEHWTMLVITRDRPGLLARLCGVLALDNLRILAARIFTWPDGTVVDQLEVVSTVAATFADQDWRALRNTMWLAVNNRLGLAYRLHRKLASMARRLHTSTPRLPERVEVENGVSPTCSVVEVYAAERVGLLYDVTRTLADFGCNILQARMGTQGDQVVLVFYLQGPEGGKIEEAEFQEEIRRALLHAVRRPPAG